LKARNAQTMYAQLMEITLTALALVLAQTTLPGRDQEDPRMYLQIPFQNTQSKLLPNHTSANDKMQKNSF